MKMSRLFIIFFVLSVLILTAEARKGKGKAKGKAKGKGGSSSTSSDSLRYKERPVCRRFNNVYYADELFPHPSRSCTMCRCCKTGKIKCFKKKCSIAQPPECGMQFQVPIDADGCCTACNSTCVDIKNGQPPLSCEHDIVFYDHEATTPEACTGVCGCEFRGHIVPYGPVVNEKVVYPCEQCTCDSGNVTCAVAAQCPSEWLNCVNPTVNQETCQWTCPEGPTCWKGGIVIPGNMTLEINGKYCTCIQEPAWWPYAACGNPGHEAVFEQWLETNMCVKKAIAPPLFYNV